LAGLKENLKKRKLFGHPLKKIPSGMDGIFAILEHRRLRADVSVIGGVLFQTGRTEKNGAVNEKP
jgi:hypothetical protein